MVEVTISKALEGQTIYKFVKKYFSNEPLSFVEKIFRLKDVKANGKRVNKDYIIKENDLIQIYVTEKQIAEKEKPKAILKPTVKPDIIYEDENILICNKPSGLLVHGDAHEKKHTLSNIVLAYLSSKGEYDPKTSNGFTPGPAHRIDRNTSGIVIFGKTIKALQKLENLFEDRDAIHKYYYALVCGKTEEKGTIDLPLYKDEKLGVVSVRSIEEGGKHALTTYETKEYFKKYSLVEACILTGRTHQIRVHFSAIKHPLIGDVKYGNEKMNKDFISRFNYTGQFLHAYKMKFDIIDGELSYLSEKEFKAPLKDTEKKILSELRKENKN